MNPSRPSLLSSLFGLSARAPRGPDFGDMGTAIGLDFTLDQPPVRPGPAARPSGAPAASAPGRWGLGRLTRR